MGLPRSCVSIRKHVDAAAAGDVGELSRNLFGGEDGEAVAQDEILRELLERGLQCARRRQRCLYVHRRRFLVIKNVKEENGWRRQVEVAADDDLRASCTEWWETRGRPLRVLKARLRKSRFGW